MFQSLGRGAKETQARNSVLETIQAVKVSSLAWPSALVVDPLGNQVYGLEFRTVASCSFEPPVGEEPSAQVVGLSYKHGLISGDGILRPYPFGHTGGAIGFTTGGSVDFGNFTEYDLVEGVHISVWVYPLENMGMSLVSKGDSWGVKLQRGGGGPVVSAFLSLADVVEGQAPRESTQTFTAGDYPLVLNRWNRVVFSYDRTVATIAIDSFGRGALERFRQKEERRLFPDRDASLVVGGGDGPIVGRIDDLLVAGILAGQSKVMPPEVGIKPRPGPEGSKPWQIRFRDGKLDADFHREPQTVTLVFGGREYPITIGMMGNIDRGESRVAE
jgi:hypothetical protein